MNRYEREGRYYLCSICGSLHTIGFSHDEYVEEISEEKEENKEGEDE